MITVTTQESVNVRCGVARPGLWRRIGRLLALSRQRRALARLDDHMLKDIGLTRHQAYAEAQKRVWDVPASWRD